VAETKEEEATVLDDALKCAICFNLCERPITVRGRTTCGFVRCPCTVVKAYRYLKDYIIAWDPHRAAHGGAQHSMSPPVHYDHRPAAAMG
jgi:hypothetical protein